MDNLAAYESEHVLYGRYDGEVDSISNALIMAACEGDLAGVKQYEAEGGDIHARNEEPFRSAALGDYLSIVRYLVGQGVDINVNSGTAVASAIGGKRYELADYLIEEGIDLVANEHRILRSFDTFNNDVAIAYLVERYTVKQLGDVLTYHADQLSDSAVAIVTKQFIDVTDRDEMIRPRRRYVF